MDIFQILLQSNVIEDMRNNYSAMIAAVVSITLILIAIDRIREFLFAWHDNNMGSKIDKEFGGSIGSELVRYNRLATKYRGSVAGDMYARKYRQGLNDYDQEDEIELHYTSKNKRIEKSKTSLIEYDEYASPDPRDDNWSD